MFEAGETEINFVLNKSNHDVIPDQRQCSKLEKKTRKGYQSCLAFYSILLILYGEFGQNVIGILPSLQYPTGSLGTLLMVF